MHTGAITNYVDVAQLTLYGFWVFFAGLVLYLRGEDKREGYPLEDDGARRGRIQGFPSMPKPKTFLLANGGIRVVPDYAHNEPPLAAVPIGKWIGAPLEPTGDPMRDAVGPASYANRAETPDLTFDGHLRIVPLRAAPGFSVETSDPDPRGMAVFGLDGIQAGTVTDIWVDRAETVIRYLEISVANVATPTQVLLPITFTRIEGGRRRVRVKSIRADQFAFVPQLAKPEEITLREEDRIMGYYGGGHLYATASRMGPLL